MSTDRELTIDELDAVSGGLDACKTTICVPTLFVQTDVGPGSGGGGGAGGSGTTPGGAWNDCLGVFGFPPMA
jgi:hypothetical protein